MHMSQPWYTGLLGLADKPVIITITTKIIVVVVGDNRYP